MIPRPSSWLFAAFSASLVALVAVVAIAGVNAATALNLHYLVAGLGLALAGAHNPTAGGPNP